MSKKIDLTGRKYGRLTVLYQDQEKSIRTNRPHWLCVCECLEAKQVSISGSNLRSGHTQSCGCFSKETTSRVRTTHGLTHSSEYRIWNTMWARCYNPNNEEYKRYGDRGIAVCDEWIDDFMKFYNDMGPRPSRHHSIDRKDNDKGYSKDNCRWATWEEQQNNRSTNIFYSYNGVFKTLATWCRELELDYLHTYRKVRKGMTLDYIVKAA